MRSEVYDWVWNKVDKLHPDSPVMEVGSYDVNGSIRNLFPEPYIGIDARPGPGVDHVVDIQRGDSWLYGHFNTVVCVESLEHMTRPWEALAEMRKALKPNGLLLATWCFDFPIHEYPIDFWRVTPEGFKYILGDVGFTDIHVETNGGTPEKPVGVFASARRQH